MAAKTKVGNIDVAGKPYEGGDHGGSRKTGLQLRLAHLWQRGGVSEFSGTNRIARTKHTRHHSMGEVL